jgi:hypothetical protein
VRACDASVLQGAQTYLAMDVSDFGVCLGLFLFCKTLGVWVCVRECVGAWVRVGAWVHGWICGPGSITFMVGTLRHRTSHATDGFYGADSR